MIPGVLVPSPAQSKTAQKVRTSQHSRHRAHDPILASTRDRLHMPTCEDARMRACACVHARVHSHAHAHE
eukprot:11182576-Lingulodinium_polyedra.AAC.1